MAKWLRFPVLSVPPEVIAPVLLVAVPNAKCQSGKVVCPSENVFRITVTDKKAQPDLDVVGLGVPFLAMSGWRSLRTGVY